MVNQWNSFNRHPPVQVTYSHYRAVVQLTRGEGTYDAVLNAEAELILDVWPLDQHLNYRSTRDQLQPHDRVLPCSLAHTQTRIHSDTENHCESERRHYIFDCNFSFITLMFGVRKSIQPVKNFEWWGMAITPASHHSKFFYWLDALPDAKPTVSK